MESSRSIPSWFSDHFNRLGRCAPRAASFSVVGGSIFGNGAHRILRQFSSGMDPPGRRAGREKDRHRRGGRTASDLGIDGFDRATTILGDVGFFREFDDAGDDLRDADESNGSHDLVRGQGVQRSCAGQDAAFAELVREQQICVEIFGLIRGDASTPRQQTNSRRCVNQIDAAATAYSASGGGCQSGPCRHFTIDQRCRTLHS